MSDLSVTTETAQAIRSSTCFVAVKRSLNSSKWKQFREQHICA